MGFIKFILITVLVFWLIRNIGGYLLKSWLGKVMKQQQGFSDNSSREQSKHPEGEIFITKTKDEGPAKSDAVGGDYVDFEEVD